MQYAAFTSVVFSFRVMRGFVVHVIAILLMHLGRLPIFTNLLSATLGCL